MTPRLPNPGTDNDRLLLALQMVAPDVLWNANSQLGLMAHSRASSLREMGWDIVSHRKSDKTAAKGARWGYSLQTPREEWPEPLAPRPMRVISKGSVVA